MTAYTLTGRTLRSWGLAPLAVSLFALAPASADDLEARLAELAEQNAALLALAQKQQSEIEALKQRLDQQQDQVDQQREQLRDLSLAEPAPPPLPARQGNDRLLISGEAGLAFFAGEDNNEFPNEEFRVEDVRLFLEAQVHRNAYLVSTLEIFRRESYNSDVQVGPLFLDIENVFGLRDQPRLFNLRLGRFDTPFGHEYAERYVMDNPLVSHTAADLWGIDEGIGLYGEADRFSYALALQNGGTPLLRDFDSDKSLAGRFGYDITDQLHLSASLMRTGDLDAAGDGLSEMWIGNVVFLPIGSSQTSTFWAELAQVDFRYSWKGGRLLGAYGEAWYDDNDPLADNSRDFAFYHLEARQDLGPRLYAALRYSALDVPGGYPIAGNGSRDIYLFGGILTERLERLSLGLGYWIYDDLVFKLEYSKEDGDQTNGQPRRDTDQFAAEVGVRF